MNYGSDLSCLDRLQREAITCLNGFPNKVRALNDIITAYAPEVTKRNLLNKTPQISELLPPNNSDVDDCNSQSEKLDPTVLASSSGTKKSVSHERISKKNHQPSRRRSDHKILRHRPGPLAHILAFLSNSLALCTKATVIRPSRYIANQALAMLRDTLIQRGQLINVQCGPSTIRSSSLSEDTRSLEMQINLGTTLDNCIGIMRPAAAQLIADTTKLKRWLQALALTHAPPTPSLTYAIRRTEAVDGWAYELFFHLKYLQENHIRNSNKNAALGFKICNYEVRHANLWHRLVQLRDNYAYLYEILHNDNQLYNSPREST